MNDSLTVDEKPSLIMMQTALKKDDYLFPPGPWQTLRADFEGLVHKNVRQADHAAEAPLGPLQTILVDLSKSSSKTKHVLGIVGAFVLFFGGLLILFPSAPDAPPASAPAAAPAMSMPPAAVAKSPAVHSASRAKDLQAHHLFGQDYSLTWKDRGPDYSYRVYYSNDSKMLNPQIAFFRPVTGDTYRFTIDGDPKNVWMAIAPIDAQQHEGHLSRPVNIGTAI